MSSEKEPGPPSLPAGLLLLGAPAALFGAVMAGNAVNVPASDDYGAIVPFLNGWRLAAGFGPRLHLLWEQFCSTRQPLTRAAAVLASGSGGACDLRILDPSWRGSISTRGAANRSPAGSSSDTGRSSSLSERARESTSDR